MFANTAALVVALAASQGTQEPARVTYHAILSDSHGVISSPTVIVGDEQSSEIVLGDRNGQSIDLSLKPKVNADNSITSFINLKVTAADGKGPIEHPIFTVFRTPAGKSRAILFGNKKVQDLSSVKEEPKAGEIKLELRATYEGHAGPPTPVPADLRSVFYSVSIFSELGTVSPKVRDVVGGLAKITNGQFVLGLVPTIGADGMLNSKLTFSIGETETVTTLCKSKPGSAVSYAFTEDQSGISVRKLDSMKNHARMPDEIDVTITGQIAEDGP